MQTNRLWRISEAVLLFSLCVKMTKQRQKWKSLSHDSVMRKELLHSSSRSFPKRMSTLFFTVCTQVAPCVQVVYCQNTVIKKKSVWVKVCLYIFAYAYVRIQIYTHIQALSIYFSFVYLFSSMHALYCSKASDPKRMQNIQRASHCAATFSHFFVQYGRNTWIKYL